MPSDPHNLRVVALIVLILLLYSGRMAKGAAKETPEGLKFGMKPLVLWSRILAVLLYMVLIFYPLLVEHRQIPIWIPVLVIAVLIFAFYQLPGTIFVTPNEVKQRFWLRGDKIIPYRDVRTVRTIQTGRITRVIANNGTVITHNSAHADSERFRQELTDRTGKHVTI